MIDTRTDVSADTDMGTTQTATPRVTARTQYTRDTNTQIQTDVHTQLDTDSPRRAVAPVSRGQPALRKPRLLFLNLANTAVYVDYGWL